MLPSRSISAILSVGLGAACLVWGALAPEFVHADGRLPTDLQNTTITLEDHSATVRDIVSGEVVDSPVTRQLHYTLLPPFTEDSVTMRVGITDMKMGGQGSDLQRLVSAATVTYPVDRVSGKATAPGRISTQLATDAASLEIPGVWLKFPTDVPQDTIDLYDPQLRAAYPAHFERAEQRDGREVYIFSQDIEPTNLAQAYFSYVNTIKVDHEGTPETAYLFHSAHREIAVDQISGLIVDWNEQVTDFYGNVTGQHVVDAFIFDGEMPEDQSAQLLAQAREIGDGKALQVINWVVLGAGVVLVLGGVIVLVWRRKAKAWE